MESFEIKYWPEFFPISAKKYIRKADKRSLEPKFRCIGSFFLGLPVLTGQTKPNFSGRKIVSYKGPVVISYLLPSEAIQIVSR